MDLNQAREVLVMHSRSKNNGHFPSRVTHEHQLTNPICGDHVQIKLHIKNDHISEIGFLAKACAICSASTSLMCEEVKGKSLNSAKNLSLNFEESILASLESSWPNALDNLKSFEHLKVNPTRRACALLPWVALRVVLILAP